MPAIDDIRVSILESANPNKSRLAMRPLHGCVFLEIQLQRQIAGIASRYHGECPGKGRHAAFVFRADRFRVGRCRFVCCKNASAPSRTHHHSVDRSRVVCAKKTEPGISASGRACTQRIAALWQLRITHPSSPGKGERFLSHCANGFPSFACWRWRRELAKHVAKNCRPRFRLARQKACYLAFARLAFKHQSRVAGGLQRKLLADGNERNDIRHSARFQSKA